MAEAPGKRQAFLSRWEELKNLRSSWIPHWWQLSDFFMPRGSRFYLWQSQVAGRKKHQHIINGAATKALRTLGSGLMAGATSPARPWWRFATDDPDLMKVASVQSWLHQVEQRIRSAHNRSNVNRALHSVYMDLGLYGTAPSVLEEDAREGMRMYTIPIGQYALGVSDRGEVNALYRESQWSVSQLVQRFGLKACSNRVRTAYDRGRYDEPITVLHIIEPREQYDRNRKDGPNKPWASVWMELESRDSGLLSEKGFDDCPLLAPRWDVVGTEVYGDSPAMDALGDNQATQLYERRKAQVVEKMADPAMVGPGILKLKGASLLPGKVTWLDGPPGGQKLEPIYQPPPAAVEVVEGSIRESVSRINEALYKDLWLAMLADDRAQPETAREVAEKHEEKMLQLGPVMDRLDNELYAPLIERSFQIELRAGRIPKPPRELQGKNLRIEYLSIMAQAQRLLGAGSMQQLAAFGGNLATITGRADVLDKLDTDAMLDKYAAALGVDPEVLRSEDEVQQLRQQRAQQQAQQAQMQQVADMAPAAKQLSETNVNNDSVLARMVGGPAAAQVGGQ